MDNLTRRLRVAFASADANPVPGHHLVVFKKLGAGQSLRAVLAPGERLKLKLFESPESLLAYAVSDDPHLRHRFSRPYEHVDSGHLYTLHFVLSFSVKDPRRLVEQIEGDPLGRLEHETVRLFGGAIRRLSWAAIEREDEEIEAGAQSRSRADFSGIVRSNLESLQGFAESLGLALVDVGITRTLPDEVTSGRRRVNQIEEEEKVQSAEHRLSLENAHRDGELATLRQSIGGRLHVHSSAAETLAKMIERLGGEIRSVSELQEALPRLEVILESTRRLAVGEPGSLGGAAVAGMLPGAASTPSALAAGTSELAALTSGALALRHGEGDGRLSRRRLCAAVLHLAAELSRGEEADAEALAEIAAAIEGEFRRLLPALVDEEVRFLHRLQDLQALRERLASEEQTHV